MIKEGICFLPYSLKLTTVVMVLAREDVEVHLHAAESKTECFWLCVL
jgi:hypothetical protein